MTPAALVESTWSVRVDHGDPRCHQPDDGRADGSRNRVVEDVSDLDRFLGAHLDPVYAAARLLTADRDATENLVLATFGTAAAAGRWPAPEQVRPWLYRLLLGTLTATTTHPERHAEATPRAGDTGCHADRQSADDQSADDQPGGHQGAVQRALRALSVESRFAVYLADVELLSHREIGEILDEHPGAVCARLHAAHRALAVRLPRQPPRVIRLHSMARDARPDIAKGPRS